MPTYCILNPMPSLAPSRVALLIKKKNTYCLKDLGYQLRSLKLLFIPQRLEEIQGTLIPGSC